VGFNGEINATTLVGGLKVYKIATVANASTGGVPIIHGITGELNFGSDYVTTVSGNKIVILPIKPLDGNQSYMVVLTTGITDNTGKSIGPDIVSELFLQTKPLVDANGNHTTLPIDVATQLEGIRQATDAMIQYTVGYTATIQQAIPRENIVAAWSFKTQTIGAVAQAFVTENTSSARLIMRNRDINTSAIGGLGKADIWDGNLTNLPYYLGIPSPQNPLAPLSQHFVGVDGNTSFTGMPKLNADITIPVLMTKPNADSTAVKKGATAPWPVVIFQHGITQNRTNLLAIADALADAGYAAIAIDLPLHGVTETHNPFYAGDLERTFNLDFINNETQASGPDGNIDPSGSFYINLEHLLTSRDNVRQTTSDLISLKNALSDLNDINSSRVAFVGHSLGTIAPFGFLAHEKLESVTLAMPGGGIAQLLNNSATFGPIIAAGLAQKGIQKGSSDYAAFMLATQTILDDADPINYAIQVGATQKVFAIEVVGDSQLGHLSDQVIPNNVPTAPLAGTDPLVNYLQARTLSGNATPNKTARYIVGNHSSILDPSESPAATTNMQTQVATFVGSKGTAIPVGDSTLLNTGYHYP